MAVVSTMKSQHQRPIDAAANDRGGDDLFEHAPPSGLQRRFGLVKPAELNIGRRGLLVVLIAGCRSCCSRSFAIVGMAIVVIAAGRSAHRVLTGGGLPTPHFLSNAGLLATLLVLFTAPLLVFMPPLVNAWRRGTLEYGALANQVGHAFERKWLDNSKVDAGALEHPDFSATTDLYGVAANVDAMRFVPVDIKDLIALAVAMLVPFVPVVLLAFPLDVIWKQVKSLLL